MICPLGAIRIKALGTKSADGTAVCDRYARVAHLVRRRRRPLLAVQAFGEDASQRRLARSARPGEEIGLPDLLGGDRVLERADDRFLADDLVEVLWTVLPVEGGHPVDLTGGPGLVRPTCVTGLISPV